MRVALLDDVLDVEVNRQALTLEDEAILTGLTTHILLIDRVCQCSILVAEEDAERKELTARM